MKLTTREWIFGQGLHKLSRMAPIYWIIWGPASPGPPSTLSWGFMLFREATAQWYQGSRVLPLRLWWLHKFLRTLGWSCKSVEGIEPILDWCWSDHCTGWEGRNTSCLPFVTFVSLEPQQHQQVPLTHNDLLAH